MSDTDSVDKQPHYTQFKVQPIDFIRANIDSLDPLQANVIKYVCRYKLKGGRRDLEKALDYLRMMVEDWDSAMKTPTTDSMPTLVKQWLKEHPLIPTTNSLLTTLPEGWSIEDPLLDEDKRKHWEDSK